MPIRGTGRRFIAVLIALGLAQAGCTGTARKAAPKDAETTPASERPTARGGFALVGSDPLFARGMNAGLAVADRYAYVGSRTDASSRHPRPGVLVVDIADPARPRVVGEIPPPDGAGEGSSSRELRAWPAARLLLVLSLGCSATLHRCAAATEDAASPAIRFYDIAGDRAAAPVLVATYVPSFAKVHEMFLWTDPVRPGRALLYLSTNAAGGASPSLIVLDISRARENRFREVLVWRGNDAFRDPSRVRLHSVGISPDGARAYLAYQGAGVLVLDTADLARAAERPAVRLLTPVERGAAWPGPGPHSAIRVPGRTVVLATDEVYAPCPWAWVHLVEVADETRPRVAAEHRIAENDARDCRDRRGGGFSFTPHNPTIASDIAFVSWHSGGLRAISLFEPAHPGEAGIFLPEPLPQVATEDPALTAGGNRVAVWSYPIVSSGLVYVVDVRNGLFVLRYDGPGGERVSATRFAEGNSNLG